MTSIRHNGVSPPAPIAVDTLLDAARASILAVGWRRSTLTDVARRAGVSRMTIYRRWPDMQTLLADLMVREWGGVVDEALAAHPRLADRVRVTISRLREEPLFRRIVEVDPEVLLPYLLDRRGRNQDRVLALLTDAIEKGQRDGDVRPGDPQRLAGALLLALQGFLLSARTVAELPLDQVDEELGELVERYLRP
jgi:AcrR family transcriptional regulator